MLNTVETTLTVAGKKSHFVKLQLFQKFNKHHKAEILVDFEEIDSHWMANPISLIKMIGESLTIVMRHKKSGESNTFSGIITNIAAVGYHGEQNHYKITGMSHTILLDGKETMDSFTGQNLQTMVQEIVNNSGNGAKVNIKPIFSEKIDYFGQYKETAFEVLNRLSWIYNEWFYSDGTNIYFGKPDSIEEYNITYDLELSYFNMSANLVAPRVSKYNYMVHMDKDIDSETPDRVEAVRGYIKVALDRSKLIYTSNANVPLETTVNFKKELDDLMEAEKNRITASMLTFEGKAISCKIKIGSIAHIALPKKGTVESFLVTEVIHSIEQGGYYSNTFKGIPSGFTSIPMKKIPNPVATSQIATVMSNADEKGRVKVQYHWQKRLNKMTNWIRIQTPDAGSSSVVANNRSFVFIPEKGDHVMINFEDSNPSEPYVSGSMFSELVGQGGYSDNMQKSIITRSGIKIVFNDNQKSLHIEDPSGNTWDMDGQGNIKINAPHNMSIAVGDNMDITIGNNLTINTGSSILMDAGSDISISAGSNFQQSAGKDLSQSASGNINELADNKIEIIDMGYSRGSKKSDVYAEEISITSAKENMVLQSAQTVSLNSSEKTNLF